MSSWDGYIANLMANDKVMDAAIAGFESGSESLWASHNGLDAKLKDLKPEDIKALVSKDRSKLFSDGALLAKAKCTVLRDMPLNDDNAVTMDLRTKATSDSPDTFSICIGKSKKALVIVKGKKDVHGGVVNKIAHDMAEYLIKQQY